MNAPFDPGAVADDAVRQMEEGQGPLVLSVPAPLISARELIRRRYTQSGGRTIHHHQSVFYVWDGTHYREMKRDEICAVIYAFLDGAKRLNRDDQLVPFNPTRNKVSDVLEALAAEVQLPGATRAPAWLDEGPNPEAVDILSCANGLLHLPKRTLLPHTPNFFSVNAVDYRYETLGQEPVVWLSFLRSIWGDDQESIDTLQELFGLLLTHDTSQQKMFMVVGPKRSGKGTIARTLRGLLGGANVRNGSHPFHTHPKLRPGVPDRQAAGYNLRCAARRAHRCERRGRAVTSHYWRGHHHCRSQVSRAVDRTAADAFLDPDERAATSHRCQRCACVSPFHRSLPLTERPFLLRSGRPYSGGTNFE